ncbi:Ninja [Macleaya cordata]|uniref:Ninja-family protein n=1 Tax=Macleaya cordata TaxID=56857 RepID=A0A200QBQ2_MACCD|nr:Ninja [Macleaya cordata]
MEILEAKEDEIELSLGLSIGGGRSFRKFDQKPSSMSSSITFDSKFFENELRKKREMKQIYKKDGIFGERKSFDLVNKEKEEGSEQICKKLKVEDVGIDENALNQKNPNNPVYSSLPFPVLPMQYGFQPMQYVPFGTGFNFPYQMMPCWVPPSSTVDDKNVVQPIACKPFRPFQFSNSVVNHNLPMENCDSDHNVSKCSGVKDTESSGSGGNSSSAVSDHRSGSHLGNEIGSRSNHSPPPSDQPHLHDAVMSDVHIQSDHSISSDPLKSSLVAKEANPLKSSLVAKEANTNFDKLISSNTAQSNLSKTEDEPTSITNPLPISNKPISNTDLRPHFLPPLQQLKGPSVDNYKPPKPRPPHQSKGSNEDSNNPLLPPSPHHLKVPDEETNQLKKPNEETNQSPKSPSQPPKIQPLPKMPCVSTVGNGPNGKTITGFLYRYTKTEVSIICVCHGSSFSPAEFVKHAGGTDVSHPLKHIVVVPSAFS